MKIIFRLSYVAAVAGVAMVAAFAAAAQVTNSAPGTNEIDERELLVSNVVDHVMAVAETNVAVASNDLALIQDALLETNNPAPTNATAPDPQDLPRDYSRNGDSRSNRRKSGRDSYQSRSSRAEDSANSNPAGATSTTAGQGPGRPDFSAFRIIAERNIFDPNRRGSRPSGTRERARTVDAFSLVGIMSYEKGTFAFFDGSSSNYRKALKQNDSIAGYTVRSIDDSQVTLMEGTNRVDLRVGTQMRREDGGRWNLSRQPENFASNSSSSPSATTTTTISNPSAGSAGGDESDVLRRLRERRDRE